MITAKQMHELLTFRTPAPAVVSAYLELEDDCSSQSLLRQFQKLSAGHAGVEALSEDLKRIERWIADELEPSGARAAAVFSAKRFGLWRAARLPQAVKPSLSVGVEPELRPLISMADQHHRFGVLLAGAERARFLEVFMGGIREYPELELKANEVPGGRVGYPKAAADKLEGLSRNQGFQRIVVGASPDVAQPLMDRLHTSLQQNLIVDTELDPEAAEDVVLGRIIGCERDARKVRESVLVHRLIDSARSAPKQAVLGLDRTLDALQRGQVRVLLVRDGFAKMGRSCPSCGLLSLAWSKCVRCNRPTEAVFNVVAEMIHRALDLNCEVFRLLHEGPLDNLGRIGAQLAEAAGAAPSPTEASQAQPQAA